MSGYALHPEAFTDLDDIRAYIAEDNPDAADRVITEIFDGIRRLVASPHQGYRGPNLTSRPMSFLIISPGWTGVFLGTVTVCRPLLGERRG